MKAQVKIINLHGDRGFHVALLSPKVPAGFKYLKLMHTFTKDAAEEWISRIRGISKASEVRNLVSRHGSYI
jgi:hypothetical protein